MGESYLTQGGGGERGDELYQNKDKWERSKGQKKVDVKEEKEGKEKKEEEERKKKEWGCSSLGRAPPWRGGGTGIEALQLQ